MKVNLPVYLISRNIFNTDNFLLFVCFIVPLALIGYWLFNLSQEDESDEKHPALNFNWTPEKNKKKVESSESLDLKSGHDQMKACSTSTSKL